MVCSVHRDESHDTHQFTMMVMQWGQFLDHDLTSTPTTRGFRQSVPKVGCSGVLHCTVPSVVTATGGCTAGSSSTRTASLSRSRTGTGRSSVRCSNLW